LFGKLYALLIKQMVKDAKWNGISAFVEKLGSLPKNKFKNFNMDLAKTILIKTQFNVLNAFKIYSKGS
jgi:hypothetical protein